MRRGAADPARSRRRLGGALVLHAVLTQALTTVLRPALSYRALELDLSPALLGALAASFAVVPLLLALPSGQLVDRVGERVVLLAGGLAMAAACATALLTGDVRGVLAASVLLGIGHLLSVVGEQALVANRADSSDFDGAFGRYTFLASLGQTLGPALLLVFAGNGSVPDTGAVFAGASAGALLLFCTSAAVRPSKVAPGTSETVGSVRALLRLPGLFRALLMSSVVLTTVDITLVYLPALGVERGLSAGLVGVLLALRAAASMTSRLLLGRLSRRLGRRRLLLWSLALSTVGTALAPVPMPIWLLALVMVGLGLGLGVGQPVTMAWLAESAPPGARGRAMSLRLTGNRLGQVVLPAALGAAAGSAGAAGVLWLTAAALAGVSVTARRLHTAPTPLPARQPVAAP